MKPFHFIAIIALIMVTSSCKNDQSYDADRVEDTDQREDAVIDGSTYENEGQPTTEIDDPGIDDQDSTVITRNVNPNNSVESNKKTLNNTSNEESNLKFLSGALSSSSLQLYSKNGQKQTLKFGQSYNEVAPIMNNYIKASINDKSNDNCNGSKVRVVEWENYITLLFEKNGSSWILAGWNLQARDSNAMKFKTTNGMSIGMKVNSGSSLTKTSLGYLQTAESINAMYPSNEDGATATSLFAGINCYALDRGSSPEGEKN